MSLEILSSVFNIAGAFVLTLVAILDYPHQRIFAEKQWWKKYWWQGWRPFYKNTQTLKWKMKLNSMVVRYGFIPPKHQWNIMGFAFILIGFILQLKAYLS